MVFRDIYLFAHPVLSEKGKLVCGPCSLKATLRGHRKRIEYGTGCLRMEVNIDHLMTVVLT